MTRPMPTRRVLVTRPRAQALEWVERLQAAHIDAQALPLIGIAAPEDPAPVEAAWQRLARYTLVMFVSPNAADHFFARRPEALAWPAATLAGSPGPGTTAALAALGVPRAQIVEPAADAPQFDSEALWQQLAGRAWQGAGVLIVRGESGRDWLAARLQEAGAQVELVAGYRRVPPRLDKAERAVLAAALARPDEVLWWFSSSEAIGHLEALVAAAGADRASAGRPEPPFARAVALVTHPRIEARARQAGFGRVETTRPEPQAVITAMTRSIQSPAP